jgi:hypothetical protein
MFLTWLSDLIARYDKLIDTAEFEIDAYCLHLQVGLLRQVRDEYLKLAKQDIG